MWVSLGASLAVSTRRRTGHEHGTHPAGSGGRREKLKAGGDRADLATRWSEAHAVRAEVHPALLREVPDRGRGTDGRAAGLSPQSQRSGHERWGLRFPWQQRGLKLVQSLEGRSERPLLRDGLSQGGGAQGGAAPKTLQETTRNAERAVTHQTLQRPWVGGGS